MDTPAIKLLEKAVADQEARAKEVEAAEEAEESLDDRIARHAEKHGLSWADSWRYHERHGYDMAKASPQYQPPDTI